MSNRANKNASEFRIGDGPRATGGRAKTYCNFRRIFSCTFENLLLGKFTEAATEEALGSPGWAASVLSSFKQFRKHQCEAEAFSGILKSIGRGVLRRDPYMNGISNVQSLVHSRSPEKFVEFASGFCEGKPRRETNLIKQLNSKTPKRHY